MVDMGQADTTLRRAPDNVTKDAPKFNAGLKALRDMADAEFFELINKKERA